MPLGAQNAMEVYTVDDEDLEVMLKKKLKEVNK